MELTHSFTVPVPLDQAWDVLLDVERVVPCMPGATLESVAGDDITGKIKVKVGQVSVTYTGQAQVTERDRAARVVRLEASGKEARGAGTASASVRSELTGDGEQTHVTVLTSLDVTGKSAQFDSGELSDAGDRLIGIFADNLAKMLAEQGPEPAASEQPVPADETVAADETGPAEETVTLEPAADPDQAVAAESAAPAEPVVPEVTVAAGADPAAGSAGVLALSIEELNLPLRAYNSLRREGVHTIGDLVARTPQQLLAIDNIGRASVEEIRQRLADRGLALSSSTAASNGSTGSGTVAASTASPAPEQEADTLGVPSAEPRDDEPAAAEPTADAPTAEVPVVEVPVVEVPEAETSSPPPLRSVPEQAVWEADDDAVDLLSVGGLPMLRRAGPAVAGVVVVAILVTVLRRSRRRRK